MPKVSVSLRVPSYRHHKPSGQAVVTLDGKDHYLGPYGSDRSRAEYKRRVGEWLIGDQDLPRPDEGVSVAELALAYWSHAKQYYLGPSGNTGEVYAIKTAVRLLRTTFGDLPVSQFGPKSLKALRLEMIDQGLSRTYINATTRRIRRLFKWGVSEELVPTTVFKSLKAVDGLRQGHTEARETAPVGPIDDEVVNATLPYLPPVLADLVRLQRLTCCRPGEACRIRPMDVDTSGEIWIYRPPTHKNKHRGHERAIAIGPKAQEILRHYLLRPHDSYCFSPRESEKRRLARNHAERKTPLSCGNRPGTNRKRKPKREPGDCYDTKSYRGAIHRAIARANQKRCEEAQERGTTADLLPRWSPNQLRHTAATTIRRQFGLEAAQVTLGHSEVGTTQIYAERDLRLAIEVAKKIG